MNGLNDPAGEGNESVEDTGVRPGLDRIGEASADADLGSDDLVSHAEDVLGDLIGGIFPTPGEDDTPTRVHLGERAPGGVPAAAASGGD